MTEPRPALSPMIDMIDRRDALAILGAAGAASIVASALAQTPKPGEQKTPTTTPAGRDLAAVMGWDAAKGEYILPKLPYEYNALEPHLDAQTMEIHYTKHHKTYVDGLNKALAELKKSRDSGDFALVKHWSRELGFHGGGHINHCLLWMTMAPAPKGDAPAPPAPAPGGKLAAAIARDFGSFDAFSKHFQAAAVAVEGGGWAWLVYDHIAGRLMVQQMEKQQNLLMTAMTPLLGVDVWEHAYYLKYQNKRADYVKAWMNVINWPAVEMMFEHAGGMGKP